MNVYVITKKTLVFNNITNIRTIPETSNEISGYIMVILCEF